VEARERRIAAPTGSSRPAASPCTWTTTACSTCAPSCPSTAAQQSPKAIGAAAQQLFHPDGPPPVDILEAAADGIRIAGDPEVHDDLRYAAVLFWCEAGPVIREAYADVLVGLG
jgi:hypothetical protein